VRRRWVVALSLAWILSLSACGVKKNRALQDALDFRSSLAAAGGCSFQADISARYDEADQMFSGACRYKTEEGAEITLTAPDTIAGIQAKVTKDGADVSFEDTAVAFGPLAEGSFAPMAIPYILGSCWAGEWIESAGEENGSVHVVYEKGCGNEQIRVDTWFSAETGEPELAELSGSGQKAATVRLSDFSLD